MFKEIVIAVVDEKAASQAVVLERAIELGRERVIPILQNMATDEKIRFNEMKDEKCQGYIN